MNATKTGAVRPLRAHGSMRVCAAVALSLLCVFITGSSDRAQSLTYSRGQKVWPAFEGWENNADGTFSLVFGYMNENWEEEIDVPVGAQNGFAPLAIDQGQPTHFLPRRNRFVFKVKVAADFGQQELIWTLTTHGATEKAYASLKPDYFIDGVVVASETGALGAGSSSPALRANRAPIVKIDGATTRHVKVGEPLVLTALLTDDGVPRVPIQTGGAPAGQAAALARRALAPPIRLTVGKNLGLHLSWFVYRGAGRVTFSPVQTKVWEDTRAGANSPWAPVWIPPALPPDQRWTTEVTFDDPGSYVLRARADDGALLADEDVNITVVR